MSLGLKGSGQAPNAPPRAGVLLDGCSPPSVGAMLVATVLALTGMSHMRGLSVLPLKRPLRTSFGFGQSALPPDLKLTTTVS